jgi:hypothetical protein
MGRFLKSIAHVLAAIMFLALAKPLVGIKPFALGNVFYQLVNKILCF